MIRLKENNNESGQAIIEFTFAMLIVISFFFFYIKMAALFAVGNYIHYATFMSARSYFSSAANKSAQEDSGTDVLSRMTKGRWKSIVKPVAGGDVVGPGAYYDEDKNKNYWNQGAVFTFKSALSIYPWSKGGEALTLNLRSESWTGREESSEECEKKKKDLSAEIKAKVPGSVDVLWENGRNGC
jgi:hypothetical protein